MPCKAGYAGDFSATNSFPKSFGKYHERPDYQRSQFVVGTDHKFEIYREDWGYGLGWDARGWEGEGSNTEDSSIIYRGELALDMYETTTHTLGWRGVASKVIDPNAKANERQKHLVNAVHKLMEHYPPVAIVEHQGDLIGDAWRAVVYRGDLIKRLS